MAIVESVRKLVVAGTGDPLSGEVINVVIAAPGFRLPGFTLVESEEGGMGWSYVDGVLTPPPTTPEIPAPTPAELKREAIVRINRASEDGLRQYLEMYPEYEIQTWPKQEAEARAWALDENAPTPTCDLIMAERGLDKTDFMQRVLIKADLFTEMSGRAAGKRQRLEDEITALADDDPDLASKLDAIVW